MRKHPLSQSYSRDQFFTPRVAPQPKVELAPVVELSPGKKGASNKENFSATTTNLWGGLTPEQSAQLAAFIASKPTVGPK